MTKLGAESPGLQPQVNLPPAQLKIVVHREHGSVFIIAVFPEKLNARTGSAGPFFVYNEFDRRHYPYKSLGGCEAYVLGLEVRPSPGAEKFQQANPALGEGVFHRHVEGYIFPGTDHIISLGIEVNRGVEPDIAIHHKRFQVFEQVEAGGESEGPGAHGIRAQKSRVEVGGVAGRKPHAQHSRDRGPDWGFRQQQVFAYQGDIPDPAVVCVAFAVGAGNAPV